MGRAFVDTAADSVVPAGLASRGVNIVGLRNRWLVGVGVAVVIVAVGLVLLRYTLASGEHVRSSSPAGEAVPALVAYQDPQDRFSVSYPRGWARWASTDPQVALVVGPPGSEDSMLVRVVSLPTPVNPAQLGDVKAITDKLVQGSNVRMLVQRSVNLNGAAGYYYLYTIGQPGSAGFGVHAHYFLFSGSTMHVLVLQALPDTDFTDLAPTFDRIAHSYRVALAAPPVLPPAAGMTAPGPAAAGAGAATGARPGG
jgi:hypothetical protein